jgi:ABC-2 type transport system permease protein
MSAKYNQVKGMLAITKASLKATFKSPQAVFFSLFFPIVLITIFSALGKGGAASVDIALNKNSDTTNLLYKEIKTSSFYVVEKGSEQEIDDKLKKGKISAILLVQKLKDSSGFERSKLQVTSSSASQRELPQLYSFLKASIAKIDAVEFGQPQSSVEISSAEIKTDRAYKMIDFFLPGMIGFSLIGSTVFGVAFVLYSLRETLVLKRMYASPIKKQYIVLGESLSRVLFQLLTVIVLIVFGTYFYHFTLANGVVTFFNMLLMSFFALLVFMGFGFFIASIAKNQNVIPIYANLFMFPQYFLSGTFFPKSALPDSMQAIIKFLPLTALNDAMRNIAFEGAGLASCWQQILILLAWGIVVYALVAKTFKWE